MTRYFVALFLSLLVMLPVHAAENHSLNGVWDFKTDPYNLGVLEKWFDENQAPPQWDTLQVPGNWDTENEYREYTGVAWYKTEFSSPKNAKKQLVRLVFESVYNNADVWLNGEKIGSNGFGFLPFHFDINDQLKRSGTNSLVVRVDNRFKRGAIWNWGGIRRPVWLEVTAKTRLEHQHITAVPNLEAGTADISLQADVYNASSKSQRVDYQFAVYAKDKPEQQLHSLYGELTVPAGETVSIDKAFTLAAKDVALWDYNHPNLYLASLRLTQQDTLLHEQTDRFGIRKIEVLGQALLLNGKPYRPVGFNLVPEDRYTGNTLPMSRIKEDVALMKSLGANFARVSHLPLPKDYLDYLDEQGIMTFEEVSLWGKDVWVDPDHPKPKQWLEIMVEKKFNHPSVVGWSVGNEIGDPKMNPKVNAYVKGAIEHAKRLDPHRLAVYVSNTAQRIKNDASIYSDLVMLNIYGGWSNALKKAHKNFPNKAIFMSEFGHQLNNELPNQGVIDAAKLVGDLREKDYTVGGSLWTLNDYRSTWHGGEGWATGASQNRAWGLVNAYRQKKRAFYDFQKEYAPLTNAALTIKGNEASFAFNARTAMDIPAYELKDYHLEWQQFDEAGKVVKRGASVLPAIAPNGQRYQFSQPVAKKSLAAVQVDLVDALGHSLYTERLDLVKPVLPTNVNVWLASKKARVGFDKSWNANEYLFRYHNGKEWQDTAPTIDGYINIDTPAKGAEGYIVAINGAGETQSQTAVKLERVPNNLPPVILDVASLDSSLFVAYETTHYDFLYELEIGESSGEYSRQVAFNNEGVYKLPNLDAGKTYYFRLRKRSQHGFASLWSEEHHITINQ